MFEPSSTPLFGLGLLGFVARPKRTTYVERGGTEQPATALESKPEGKKKPQPKSKGRSS
ncbi:MAG: PEP-CTERM sorting domain-containing protein [Akkermansiaceae bacterium]